MKNIYRFVVVGAFCQACSTSPTEQTAPSHADAAHAREIDLNLYRAEHPNEGYGQVLDISQGEAPYSFQQEHNTDWYRLVIPDTLAPDHVLSFALTPDDPADNYDFMLFRYTDAQFFEQMQRGKLRPVRSNLSLSQADGRATGLDCSQTTAHADQAHGTGFSQSLPVQPGEVYYLVIDRTEGPGAAYTLSFDQCYGGLAGKGRGRTGTADTAADEAADLSGQETATSDANNISDTAKDSKPARNSQSESSGKNRSAGTSARQRNQTAKKSPPRVNPDQAGYAQRTQEDPAAGKPTDSATPPNGPGTMRTVIGQRDQNGQLVPRPPLVFPDSLDLLDPEGEQAKVNRFVLFLESYDGRTGKTIRTRTEVIDLEKQRPFTILDSDVPEYLIVGEEEGYQFRLAFTAKRYRRMTYDLNVLQPVNALTKESTRLRGDTIFIRQEMDRGRARMVATVYDILFHNDAAIMLPQSRYEADQLLAMLNAQPDLKVRIHGHCNGNARGKIISLAEQDTNFFRMTKQHVVSQGSAKALSQKRADVIKKYLVYRGVDPGRIDTRGWGGRRPIYEKNATEAYLNKRVEVEIIEGKPWYATPDAPSHLAELAK